MKKEMKRINVVWLDDMYPIFIVQKNIFLLLRWVCVCSFSVRIQIEKMCEFYECISMYWKRKETVNSHIDENRFLFHLKKTQRKTRAKTDCKF